MVNSKAELSVARLVANDRQRVAVLTALAVAGSLACTVLVLLVPLLPPLLVFALLGLGAVLWRPRLALYAVFALTLLFEVIATDPLMSPGRYLQVGLGATLGLTGVIVSPLELLLGMMLLAWLAQGLVHRRLVFRGGTLGWPVLLFACVLLLGLARGQVEGADTNVALWEVRWLAYLVACYVLAANLIENRAHVRALLGITLVVNGLFCLEAIYRHLVLIRGGQLKGDDTFEHVDVIFLSAALLLVVAQRVIGGPRWQRAIGPPVFIVAVYALMASERRSGWIALGVAVVALLAVLAVRHRKAFLWITVPLVVSSALYLPLFWNQTGLWGQPARAVKSLITPNARDAASNQYRVIEKANVRYTIEQNPLLGVGFGREFQMVYPLPDLSFWPFWRYQPHNNILWLWLKLGMAGFTLFFVLMGLAIARAAYLTRVLQAPELRVFALIALCTIVATLVFSWVDVGLVSGRVTVIVGMLLGVLGILQRLDVEPVSPTAAVPRPQQTP